MFGLTNSGRISIVDCMRSIWRTLGRSTVRDIIFACLAVGVIGLAYGATAGALGFPLWMPVTLATLVVAASSELLFVAIIAAGGNPFAAALAGLLVNARHLPYGLALPDVTGSGWRRLLGTHLMNDESVVFAISQQDPPRQRAAYWVCGLGMLSCWPIGALLGSLLGTVVRDTNALGLDTMFPAVITALILPKLRDRRALWPALAGAALALATTPFLPAGLPVLTALTALLLFAATSRAEVP